MRWLFKAMLGYLNFLCRTFHVTPDQLSKGRRGNLPPPQGAHTPRYYI